MHAVSNWSILKGGTEAYAESGDPMSASLRVAIIGGSETARQLIADFLSRPFIDLVAVVDLSEASPGATAAKRAGVQFMNDIKQLGDVDPAPDIIVDVCGRPHVKPTLAVTFPDDGRERPVIVHDLVARLVLSLAADSLMLAPECPPEPHPEVQAG